MIITNDVKVKSTAAFNLLNTSSLVQVNNQANSGIVNYERKTKPMYFLDYTYWNSPVTLASNFAIGNLTFGHNKLYSWRPTIANGSGNWLQEPVTTFMNPIKGYIVRAPLGFPATGLKQVFTANFIGTPNNGDISIPISIGTNANIGAFVSGSSVAVTNADDEWNLIGNPYPSSVDILGFLNDPVNTPFIDGTVYLWTHNTLPSASAPDPFFADYQFNYTANDYATINTLGNVATTTYTAAVSGGSLPSRYVASGQSFFISAEANGNVLFKNSMRVASNNATFFRTSNQSNDENNRFWLNLEGSNGSFSQTLIGYHPNATLAWDRGLDGEVMSLNSDKLYSTIPNKNLTIQGRPTPFLNSDIVPLGFKATSNSSYRISLDHFDSNFDNQDIYIKDYNLNLTHNLKNGAYVFNSSIGQFSNRFEIIYQNSVLNNPTNSYENQVIVYTNEKVDVKSDNELIDQVTVFDVLGRKIDFYKDVNSNTLQLKNLFKNQAALLLRIELQNGIVVTKKVIF